MTTLPDPIAPSASVATSETRSSPVSAWLDKAHPSVFSAYCIIAAFGTYFCMYAFRKPFTAGTYEELSSWGVVGYKTILITAQVAGYTLSKFIGIKVVAEAKPAWRATGVLMLIGLAELALLGFSLVPPPYNFVFLFLNGLPLGMVFGLVLSFLEGRQVTEALSAGLCASFIVSSGVVKSIGKWMVQEGGISEYWMPTLVGLVFVPPLLVFVWMLRRIPPPSVQDIALRSARVPMDRAARWRLFRAHAWGLSGLVLIYILLSVGRGIRDDYAVEIWQELGYRETPSIFAISEMWVMIGVVIINGLAICIRSNRSALLGSLGLLIAGFTTVLGSIVLFQASAISPFAFMVLIGLGTYVPYVAFHTTIFERFIAAFRERGNIGYLMYLADAMGYFVYVLVVPVRKLLGGEIQYLRTFQYTALGMAIASIIIAALLLINYHRQVPKSA